MSKIYSTAPLPFTGQKRNFIKHFRKVLADNIEGSGSGWTIIDVFGGSGLLAHNAKRLKPEARVIYNDFDGYSERLLHIADTNRLRKLLLVSLGDTPRQFPLSKEQTLDVVNIITEFDGYVDVNALATWLLFSGKQVKTIDELIKHKMYNTIRRSDYDFAKGYLDAIEVVNESYTELMPKYEGQDNVLFVLDPPYLNTAQGSYKQDKYFAMVDFLYLISLTKPPYIFFSSTKSELLDYMDYLKRLDGDDWNRLGNYEKVAISTHLNHNSKYEDNMIFKF